MAVTLLVCGMPQLAAKVDTGLVDELNERWTGARCRFRLDVPLKKKTDSRGWTRSVWILPRSQWEFHSGNTGALLWVSDRSAFPGQRVPPGTDFVAEGWSLADEKRGKGIGLDLRLEDRPVLVRLTLHSSFGKERGLEDLAEMERWARVDVCLLRPADERLVEPVPPVEVTLPAPFGPREAPPAEVSTGVRVELLGTGVEPTRIRPGETIRLEVSYRLEGEGGVSITVTETRSILSEGRRLAILEERVERPPGTFRSSQPLSVPNDLPPGVYEFEVRVEASGVRAEERALFQVIP